MLLAVTRALASARRFAPRRVSALPCGEGVGSMGAANGWFCLGGFCLVIFPSFGSVSRFGVRF